MTVKVRLIFLKLSLALWIHQGYFTKKSKYNNNFENLLDWKKVLKIIEHSFYRFHSLLKIKTI